MKYALTVVIILQSILNAGAQSPATDGETHKSAASQKPTAAASPKEWRRAAANRRRRLIVNNDGAEPVVKMTEPSAQQFLDLRTSPLVGSQVDSIFYCTRASGFGVFTHFTKVGQIFTCTEGRYSNNQMPALLKANIDPLRVLVDFCKRNQIEFFWSMRMNDTHDGSKTDYGPIMFRDGILKRQHPEYLMGTVEERPKYGTWTAVNYSRPEIRELAFRYFEEVCQNYDIDGIELDFFRHPVFFKSTSRGEVATDDERSSMTELMKRIRHMADEVGRKRGRPILIAMKMPDSVEYDRAIGLDIEKWMAEDLLDLFIPGGYFQLNDWDYSVALAHKYGVKVYPSLDDSRVKDELACQSRMTNLAFRARAADAWGVGADGIYLFNFPDFFSPDATLLHELGDVRVLAKKDQDYFASIRGKGSAAGGNLPYDHFMKIETLNPGNPKTLSPGKKVTTKLQLGEVVGKPNGATLKLRLQFKSPANPTSIEASINDRKVDLSLADDGWLEGIVLPTTVRRGENLVELALNANIPDAIEWTDVLLAVRH